MPVTLPQIFISSTSEFRDERVRIANELRSRSSLRCEPFIYEEETARAESGREHCAAMIGASEVVVLILGAAYGSSFPDEPEKSIVEWEFECAKLRPRLTLQTYVRKLDESVQVDPRQQRFIDRVLDFSHGSWCKPFKTAADLVKLVVAGVIAWAFEELMRERKLVRWGERRLFVTGAAIAILTLALVGIGSLLGVAASSLLIVAFTGFGMFLPLLVLVRFSPL